MPAETGFGINKRQKLYKDRHPVVHHKGSAKRPKCGCGSWLNHWLVYTGNYSAKCVYMGCSSDAEDGAHVRFVRKKSPSSSTYVPYGASFIVPMCGLHNRSRFTNPFFIHKDRWMIDDTARDLCETATYRLNRQNYFYMQVKKGNGKPKCGCRSYLRHYQLASGSSRRRCAAMGCSKPAVMAGPMKSLDKRTDYDRWVAPLCRKHGQPGAEIYIKRKAEVVSPRKCDDCGQ
ncbi:hypothetical protein [Leisingera sp. ANG-Vp]|uniref:hypothetical protein n=1 Tax=Leisingera sp. ANG-Vp TaxID=1577896 RepID=UPI00126A46E3|nr:hypothetical protein [Leisingera sp. ANG-Vp]